jgi:hypothetical protein
MSLNIFSPELLAQREKFGKKWMILQVLVDKEFEDSTFI